MRLIDGDALLRALPDDLPYKGSVRRVLMQVPEVDAVPVVRCENCLYWGIRPYGGGAEVCDLHAVHMGPHDFCCYGERLEGKSCE